MKTVRACVMPAPGQDVEIREFEEPVLEKDSGLLDVDLSEVCGTDVHLQQGKLQGVPYPIIPGHVTVGRLEKIRGRLTDVEGRLLEEGDRVTFLDVHKTCHACWYCLVAKASTRCPQRRVYGITYGIEDGLTGGWAEKLYLKPGTLCLRLNDVPSERFMAGGCSLPTAVHAIERAEVHLADTVLVLGSGPVGLSCVILARMSGASRVLCVGAPDNRLEVASQMGARTLNFEGRNERTRRDWVLEQTEGRGADAVIEATGQPQAVVQAMRWTRDGGRVVVVGQYTDHGEVPFNPHLDLNRKHIEVRASWGSDFSHFYRAVAIMNDPDRAAAWEPLRAMDYSLDQAAEALEDVASGKVVKAFIRPVEKSAG